MYACPWCTHTHAIAPRCPQRAPCGALNPVVSYSYRTTTLRQLQATGTGNRHTHMRTAQSLVRDCRRPTPIQPRVPGPKSRRHRLRPTLCSHTHRPPTARRSTSRSVGTGLSLASCTSMTVAVAATAGRLARTWLPRSVLRHHNAACSGRLQHRRLVHGTAAGAGCIATVQSAAGFDGSARWRTRHCRMACIGGVTAPYATSRHVQA